jgi:4-carboxymuconolactone decarboxylase
MSPEPAHRGIRTTAGTAMHDEVRSMRSVEDAFRRSTIGDAQLLAAMSDPDGLGCALPKLDIRAASLARIAALIALDAPESAYGGPVHAAQEAGASCEDLLALLVTVAGCVGSARVQSAAPRLALASGYDVEAALEEREPVADTPRSNGMGAAPR